MQAGIVGVRDAAEAVARRLAAAGVRVAAYDGDRERLRRAAAIAGVATRRSLATLAGTLRPPRALLVFEPDAARDLDALARCAGDGGLVADAGDGPLDAAPAHAAALAAAGVAYVDVALFGSPASVEAGFGVAAAGSREAFARFEPLARRLGFDADYAAQWVGPAGSARFLRSLQALLARQSLAGVDQLLRGIRQAPEFIGSPAALMTAWQSGATANAEIGALCEAYLAIAGAAEAPAANIARAWSAAATSAAAWFDLLAAAGRAPAS